MKTLTPMQIELAKVVLGAKSDTEFAAKVGISTTTLRRIVRSPDRAASSKTVLDVSAAIERAVLDSGYELLPDDGGVVKKE